MGDRRYMVINCNGVLDGTSYIGGTTHAVHMRDEALNFSSLTRIVHKIVQADITVYDYDIFDLIKVNGKIAKCEIHDDRDVEELLGSAHSPEVYVSTKTKISEGLVGNCSSSIARGFVELMEIFNAMKDNRQPHNPSNNIVEEVVDLRSEDHDNVVGSDNDASIEADDSLNDFDDDSPDSTPGETNVVVSTWSIPGMPSSFPTYRVDSPPSNSPLGVISEDSIFTGKKFMKRSVGYYHLQEHFEYRVKKSDKGRWQLKCKYYSSCNFKFHAVGNNGLWRTVKFRAHTCCVDPKRSAPSSLPAHVIGSYYAANQQEGESVITPKNIRKFVKKKIGMTISYNHALKARQHADESIYGAPEDSFRLLPSYLHQFEVANPDSHIRLQMDDKQRFQYVFYALRASIDGFVNHGRPVIVVDGTHLKGKYRGMVFVAVTQDCNHNIFPLATGIGPVENTDSWMWFFSRLREAYGCHKDLVIVSDQHKGIIDGVKIVYPDATHCLCYIHLQNNLATRCKNVTGFFKKAAYTYRFSEYERIMEGLKHFKDGSIYNWLVKVEPKRWSRVNCPVRRYEFMTSNAAETWNKCIVWARRLPIVQVLEGIRKINQERFHQKLELANSREGTLCARVTNHLAKLNRESDKFEVEPLTEHKYKIVEGMRSNVVDLWERTCECCEFQTDLIPCSHAVAAIRFKNYDVTTFVGDCYSSAHVKGMWGGSIMPVPDPNEWVVPDDVKSIICNPPPCNRPAGRPKLSRGKHARENGPRNKRQRCSRCKGPSHNRVHCTVSVSSDENVLQSDMASSSGRRLRRCSVCGETGHTKRKCPDVAQVI